MVSYPQVFLHMGDHMRPHMGSHMENENEIEKGDE